MLFRRKVRVGLLLNFEHYEFHIGVEFNRFFEYIKELENLVSNIFSNEAYLHIRRKSGWTNIDLLRNVLEISQFNNDKSLLISPDNVSLLEYGKSCDVVLFFQGTSAIAELMMDAIPCVYLGDTTGVSRLDAEYIKLPENVVPIMSAVNVINLLKVDANCFSGLGKKQAKWIESQMIITDEE